MHSAPFFDTQSIVLDAIGIHVRPASISCDKQGRIDRRCMTWEVDERVDCEIGELELPARTVIAHAMRARALHGSCSFQARKSCGLGEGTTDGILMDTLS